MAKGIEKQPKAFISYSWSSDAHQSIVLEWAERLVGDGVDVVFDKYDLKEGNDKFAFMERMVTDPSVTHVLVVCDKEYAEKADARKAGVGTESQIISKEVYEKIEQSKFIPIICELSLDNKPFLPTFLKSRIFINFSSPELVNENWEQLIRVLFGKPLYEKPTLGTPPVYINDYQTLPSNPTMSKYNAFKQALLQAKKGLSIFRRDFLLACIAYADALRVRERPTVDSIGKKVLEDCGKLKQVRNYIIDWVLLESEASPSDEFCQTLLEFLESLRELKSRPAELNSWNDAWFEAHALFVYETFLYIIAALMKTRSYKVLHEIFTSHYLLSTTSRYGNNQFSTFDTFYGYSETLHSVLTPPSGGRYLSPAAELIKRQADREDLPFKSVIEADLLALLMTFLTPDSRWYPQTLYYAENNREFLFFVRATQHKYFEKLGIITGIANADELRKSVGVGQERLKIDQWHDFRFNVNDTFWNMMNMDKLDSLK